MDTSVTFSDPNPTPLFRELNRFRMTGAFCDAVLSTNDGASFRVHKVAMSVCSNYFRTMFTTSLMGNSTGKDPKIYFHVPDVSSSILETIIKYAYSGIVDVNTSNVNKLLPAADQFNVSGIVDECTTFILKNMNNENCIGIWRFALDYYVPRMEDEARRFILRNFVDISVNSEEFLALNLDSLRLILSNDELNISSEQTVWISIKRWCHYKYARRQHCIPYLLTCVRMALLAIKDFQQIMNDPRVHRHMPCITYINMVSKYFSNEITELSQIDNEKTAVSMFTPRHPNEMIVVSGGWALHSATYTFEVYDCRANMWKVINFGNFSNRMHHQIVSIGKYIYVIGGRTSDGQEFLNSCWRIDTSNFTKKEISPMQEKRSFLSIAVLNGKIYALGGYDGNNRLRTVEHYDEVLNQWSYISPMNEKRSDASASSLRNRIFIVGGYNGEALLQSAECYYDEFDQWFLLPNMISCRSGVSCIALDNSVYAIGGYNGVRRTNSVEKYSIKNRQWIPINSMEKPRSNFGVVVLENKIYAIGGYNENNNSMSEAECYDPVKNQWQSIAPMYDGRIGFSACTVTGIRETERYIKDDRIRCLLKPSRVDANNSPL